MMLQIYKNLVHISLECFGNNEQAGYPVSSARPVLPSLVSIVCFA